MEKPSATKPFVENTSVLHKWVEPWEAIDKQIAEDLLMFGSSFFPERMDQISTLFDVLRKIWIPSAVAHDLSIKYINVPAMFGDCAFGMMVRNILADLRNRPADEKLEWIRINKLKRGERFRITAGDKPVWIVVENESGRHSAYSAVNAVQIEGPDKGLLVNTFFSSAEIFKIIEQ